MGNPLSFPAALRASVTGAVASSQNFSQSSLQVTDEIDDLPELEAVPECGICYEAQETLNLDCGHTFCRTCVQGQLTARWSGARMSFNYLKCSLCRLRMKHPDLEAQLMAHKELESRMLAVAVEKFRSDGLVETLNQELERDATDDEISTRAGADMAVFQCCDCREPYCAGRLDCATAAQLEMDSSPTRCPGCEWKQLAPANDHRCMVHGHRFAMFKCDSCCAVATWNCFSNHYCERCHNQASEAKHYPCPGPEKCPLGMLHPPNQEAVHCSGDFASFCIGCTACLGCREAQDVEFNENNIFGFQERDWLNLTDGAQVLKLLGEEEVRARLSIVAPGLAHDISTLSAKFCSEKLLALEKIRAKWAERAALAMEERWKRYEEAEEEEHSFMADEADWRFLQEARRAKASSRSLARQMEKLSSSERMEKQRLRRKRAGKYVPRGQRKAQYVQELHLGLELGL